jgi:hypothetical protein
MKTLTILGLLLLSANVYATDKQGRFTAGGGAGSVSCPMFLDDMATARQLGSLKTADGLRQIDGYVNYALGFQTGFNLMALGIVDIFAKVKDVNLLFAIEPWCKDHPDKNFSDGVIALAIKLSPKQP